MGQAIPGNDEMIGEGYRRRGPRSPVGGSSRDPDAPYVRRRSRGHLRGGRFAHGAQRGSGTRPVLPVLALSGLRPCRAAPRSLSWTTRPLLFLPWPRT